jgi:hypothetical protein
MTSVLTVVDQPQPGEAWTAAIVRRLLGEFGQRRLSMSAVAKKCAMSQSQFSRRMTGSLPFTTTEIEHLCVTLGLDRDYILTGARKLPTGGGSLLIGTGEAPASLLLPRLDSNQQPVG